METYTYEFANETVEVEIDEKWATVLKEMDRTESNNDKKESRRHLMLDPSKDATAWTIDVEDPEEAIIEMIDSRNDFDLAMSLLSNKQQDLLYGLFMEGLTQKEYGERTGVDQSAISYQLQTIRKKLKKLF